MRFYGFAGTFLNILVHTLCGYYKMNFWRFFTTCSPCCIAVAAVAMLYSTQQFQWQTSACVTCKWSLWETNDVCVVGGWEALQFCTFDLHTPGMSRCPPSQPPRLIAARIRLMTSRCRTPSGSQALQLDILRKTAKTTVPLKLSKYLDKNTFYNYAEQLIGFSFNCCTSECNSCNIPQPIVENI